MIRILQEFCLTTLFAPQIQIEFDSIESSHSYHTDTKSFVHSKTNNNIMLFIRSSLLYSDSNNKLKVCNWQCFVGWENMCADLILNIMCQLDIKLADLIKWRMGGRAVMLCLFNEISCQVSSIHVPCRIPSFITPYCSLLMYYFPFSFAFFIWKKKKNLFSIIPDGWQTISWQRLTIEIYMHFSHWMHCKYKQNK